MTPHDLLAEIRNRGYTLKTFAAELGCNPDVLGKTIRRERGYSSERPRGKRALQIAIAQKLGIDVNEVFGG